MKGENVVTEHTGSPTFEQLFGMLEPVNLNDLERDSLLEIYRVRKNLDLLTACLVELAPLHDSDEDETREVIEDSRNIIGKTQARINDIQLTGSIGLDLADGGESVYELYTQVVSSITDLVEFWSPNLIPPMERALIRT